MIARTIGMGTGGAVLETLLGMREGEEREGWASGLLVTGSTVA